jgi:hypothetical protein
MAKPIKSSARNKIETPYEAPKWWDSTLGSDSLEPMTQMLVNHASTTGKLVYSGTCKGVLEDISEGLVVAMRKLLTELTVEVGGTPIYTSGPIFGRGENHTKLIWPDGAITLRVGVDSKVSILVSTTDGSKYEKLSKIIGDHLLPENVRQPVYSLAEGPNGVEIIEVGVANQPWEEGNYTPEVVEQFKFSVSELQNENPTGRLILVYGEPGTGKTFFICGLINEVLDAIFVLIPSHMVEDLAGPKLIPMLIRARSLSDSDKPIVLVIEDADKALVPREEGSLASISSLLNISDGIVGRTLNLRVVCTTNAKETEIDPALMRAGRLSTKIEIGPLSPEQAQEVFFRVSDGVTCGEFEGPVPLAEIYRFARTLQIEEESEETDESEDDEDEDDDDDDDDDEDE